MPEPTPHESAEKKASTDAAKGFVLIARDPEGEKKVSAPRPTAADKRLNMDTAEKVTEEEAIEDWVTIEKQEGNQNMDIQDAQQEEDGDWSLVGPNSAMEEESKKALADSTKQEQVSHRGRSIEGSAEEDSESQ